ncbi:MAG: hypothetical protein LBB81_00210 [Treponema sp.]|jgi:hypothetical protein|nr:hypothetical protein [Treponema sp.]
MPGRLIVIIIVFAIFLAFISLNLDNKCDINFGFKTFEKVPVFLTVFSFYALGLLTSLPFFYRRKKKDDKADTGGKEENSGLILEKKNPIWAKKTANDKKKAMDDKEPHGVD